MTVRTLWRRVTNKASADNRHESRPETVAPQHVRLTQMETTRDFAGAREWHGSYDYSSDWALPR